MFAVFIIYVHLRVCKPPPRAPSHASSLSSSLLAFVSYPTYDDRNGHALAEPGSHFNVSLPYSLALGSGFGFPPPLSSDLQHPQWLPGKRDRAGSRGKGGGGFIVLFPSPLSLFIYDISSMTGDME